MRLFLTLSIGLAARYIVAIGEALTSLLSGTPRVSRLRVVWLDIDCGLSRLVMSKAEPDRRLVSIGTEPNATTVHAHLFLRSAGLNFG